MDTALTQLYPHTITPSGDRTEKLSHLGCESGLTPAEKTLLTPSRQDRSSPWSEEGEQRKLLVLSSRNCAHEDDSTSAPKKQADKHESHGVSQSLPFKPWRMACRGPPYAAMRYTNMMISRKTPSSSFPRAIRCSSTPRNASLSLALPASRA